MVDLTSATKPKSRVVALAVLVAALLVVALFYKYLKNKFSERGNGKISQEAILGAQKEEMDLLRKQAGDESLTQEQAKNQMEELGKAEDQNKQLSRDRIDKQTEDLNKLRTGN